MSSTSGISSYSQYLISGDTSTPAASTASADPLAGPLDNNTDWSSDGILKAILASSQAKTSCAPTTDASATDATATDATAAATSTDPNAAQPSSAAASTTDASSMSSFAS